MTRKFHLNAGWHVLRGAAPQAVAFAGLLAACHGAPAQAAESRATLTLRGVIHKSVTVALAPDGAGGHFSGPARMLRISEEANFASPYRLYLEGGDGGRVVFDGRSVAFTRGRALLDAPQPDTGGGTTRRTRALALAAPQSQADARPFVLVVSIP